jgi:hypothetical protein
VIDQNTTHVERGLAKLLGDFQGKPIIKGILSSRLRARQRLEDAAWEVAFAMNIATGFGIILDRIGKIVGRGRAGLLDDDYRYALRTQIRINRSNGNPQDFVDIGALAVEDSDRFSFQDFSPAHILATYLDEPSSLPALGVIESNFSQIRGIGIGLSFAYTLVGGSDEAALFGWDGTTYEDADGLAHGAAWDGTPLVGGRASDVVRLG